MSNSFTALFPFPHFVKAVPADGSLFGFPDKCLKCREKYCVKSQDKALSICSFGYNFIRIDDDIVIAGLVVKQFESGAKARQKRVQESRGMLVERVYLEKSVEKLQGIQFGIEADIEEGKASILREYIKENRYKSDFLAKQHLFCKFAQASSLSMLM